MVVLYFLLSHYIGKIQTNVSNFWSQNLFIFWKKYLEFKRLLFTGVISIKAIILRIWIKNISWPIINKWKFFLYTVKESGTL